MAKQEKVTEKKAPAKRGRKPKTEQEPVTIFDATSKKIADLSQRLYEEKEFDDLMYDHIKILEKRLAAIERIEFTFDCVILTVTLILAFILLGK